MGIVPAPRGLIPDNARGHLMQRGLADMEITGADRVTRRGDAANKIGACLKAVAAQETMFHSMWRRLRPPLTLL
ncbi:MAG: hypothetical protein LBD58_05285 [Treponema sp.]|jgi:methylthioribose-1-phosphate isomerase|nr:hypothetical protein [Treponema sp.]